MNILNKGTSKTERMTRFFVSAFNYFNKELFDSSLPEPLILFQRRKKIRGYFYAEQMLDRMTCEHISEIGLNPENFPGRPPKEILSTLVHEMCHLWQYLHGTPGRNGYHNKEWAAKMKEIGLKPTNNGRWNGGELGHNMTHLIMHGRCFDLCADEFLLMQKPLTILEDLQIKSSEKHKNAKTKFVCAQCGDRAWGKSSLRLVCGKCDVYMRPLNKF